jgi:hypothetical protein
MSSYRIFIPDCGAAGVILLIDKTGYCVEFRGRPYHQWEEGENSPMFRLHETFRRVDISRLHSEQIETVTKWHPEFPVIDQMFKNAVT